MEIYKPRLLVPVDGDFNLWHSNSLQFEGFFVLRVVNVAIRLVFATLDWLDSDIMFLRHCSNRDGRSNYCQGKRDVEARREEFHTETTDNFDGEF